MPLEAVMVCVDNSEFTRNGDYPETRFQSQTDAVNLICGAKLNQHPENCVGILTSANDRVEVMLTPTDQLGRVIAELQRINIKGNNDVLRGIQTAQLALKHRQNKNQKQRIIAFVGSPVTASDKELETLGKNLKKNNVSIDLVSFGEVDENSAKLNKLLAAVNSSDSSHLVEVPVGPKLLSDVLLSSVVVNPDGDMPAGGAAGGGDAAGFEFGIDPGADPELALALRISMEEERARQQAAEGGAPAADAGGAAPAATGDAAAPAPAAAPAASPAAAAAPAATADDITAAMGMEDMDEELRQALMLSLQEAGPPAAAMEVDNAAAAPAATPAAEPPKQEATPAPAAAAPAAAPGAAAAPAAAAAGEAGVDASWFQDPSFVQELLGSLPGVDVNDPRIQDALNEVKKDDGDKKDDKKDGK